jgi:hypothetical protein
LRPELPSAVDAVVGRTLEKNPEDRYPSCRELTLELRAALSSDPIDIRGTGGSQPRATPVPQRSRPRWMVAAVVVATALVVGLASFAAFRRNGPPGTPPGSTPGGATGSGAPQRIRDGVQVTASKTAPSSTTSQGDPVTYLPSNVIDGDVQTAWRTPGDGHGVTLTLVFDNPVDIVRVGLIPGYTKFDPVTGTNRFEQERIIKEVRYLIPGLPPTVADFRSQPYPQFVRLSATTSRITVEILDTTAPGGRDYTAISEIYVYGYRQ